MPRGTRKTYFKKKNTRNKKNIHKQRRRTRRVGSTKRKRGKLTRNTMSKKYKGGAGNDDAPWTSPTLTPDIEFLTLERKANKYGDGLFVLEVHDDDIEVQNAQLNLGMRYLVGNDNTVIGTNPPLETDESMALYYLEMAARGKDKNHIAAAKFLMADIYKSRYTQKLFKGDFQKDFPDLAAAAPGDFFQWQHGQDLGTAEQLLVDAIKLGHPRADSALHELYDNNKEVSFHYKHLYPPPRKRGRRGRRGR